MKNLVKKTAGRPAKIDIGEALKLRLINRLSYGQIARLMGVSKQSVEARLSKLLRLLSNHELIDEYEGSRGRVLSSAEMELLYHMLDPIKLERAGLGELSKAFAQVANHKRLATGLSTQNIGVNLKIEDIVAIRDKKIQELKERGFSGWELEKQMVKELSLRDNVDPKIVLDSLL